MGAAVGTAVAATVGGGVGASVGTEVGAVVECEVGATTARAGLTGVFDGDAEAAAPAVNTTAMATIPVTIQLVLRPQLGCRVQMRYRPRGKNKTVARTTNQVALYQGAVVTTAVARRADRAGDGGWSYSESPRVAHSVSFGL